MAKKKIEKEETKKISLKNYLMALLVLIGGIVLVIYIFEWYQVKQEEKYMESYLLKTNTVGFNIENLKSYKQVTQEAPNDYFIVIGYASDEKEYKMETKLKEIIDNYEINDIVYYIDVTDIKENENYIKEINKNIGINISNVPAVIYVHNRKIENYNIVEADKNNNINLNELEKILEIYEYQKVK